MWNHPRELARSKSSLIAAALAVVPAPIFAGGPHDDCAVLNFAFRQAKTEFPALKNKQFGGARCRYRQVQFSCEWGFSSDKFAEAQDQISRLERCIAAQPRAALLEKKRSQAMYQLDPDTKVLIRGPDANAGDWAIQLQITTSAKWDS